MSASGGGSDQDAHMSYRTGSILTATVMAAAGFAAMPTAASAHPQSWFANCTAVNAHWAHGIGKNHAQDATSGIPVRNFKRSSRLYRHAMALNGTLDRDGDHVACEHA
jgi:hypothetical protein